MEKWILFAIQFVLICIAFCNQIPSIPNSEFGLNISWFGFWSIFSTINYILCKNAWRHKPETNVLLQAIVHGVWAIFAATNVILAVVYGKSVIDWYVIIFVVSAISITLWIARKHFHVGLENGLVKGTVSILCRVTPQVALSFLMLKNGDSSGVTGYMILAGLGTAVVRLVNLRHNLKNPDAKASFIADIANAGSWVLILSAWAEVR